MTIRHACIDDLPALQALRNHYIAETDFLWQTQAMTDDDARAWWKDHDSPRSPIVVAIDNVGTLAGYASLSRFRTWPGYRFTAELSIYVAPDKLAHGIGPQLMDGLFAAARKSGLRCIVSWIAGGNEKSVRFHERFGFTHVGVFRGVGEKWGVMRDVIVMQKQLDDSEEA